MSKVAPPPNLTRHNKAEFDWFHRRTSLAGVSMFETALKRTLTSAMAAVILLLACPAPTWAQSGNPLLAIDTSSPRGTMRAFYDLTEKLEKAYGRLTADPGPARQAEMRRIMDQLRRLLDMQQIPPASRRKVGADTIVFLVDVLRRIELPQLAEIPDAEAVQSSGETDHWTIPGSEIAISRVTEGVNKGRFLFNSDTVARAEEFYYLVEKLPPKEPTKISSWRNVQLQAHGWMIPPGLIYGLPDNLKRSILDTPAWKLIGSFIVMGVATALVALWYRLTWPTNSSGGPIRYMLRILTPLALLVAISIAKFLINDQILIVGSFAEIFEFSANFLVYVALAWTVWLAIFLAIEWIIASPAIPDESLDASLLRLLGRVSGIGAIAMLAAHGAQQLGLPVLGVLAGLGVGGLAVALAAQSSLENFIGGVNLYADRPIRLGDFCEYGEIKGHVEHIGLRSTRIRALDRTITTVPNSQLAKVHVTNYTLRDQMLFQHVLDLRYETTTKQLRFLAFNIRGYLSAHPKVRKEIAVPRVHVVGFGDWSIKVEVYAYVDTQTVPDFLAVQEELILRLIELVSHSGSEFAFPSQTTYIARDTNADTKSSRQHLVSIDMQNAQSLPLS